MSDRIAQLKPALDALTNAERIEVLNYLSGQVEDEELTEEEWEQAWAEEVNRRIEESKAGKSDAMPHEEFMRQMREKYL